VSADALEDYVRKWREASPHRAVAWLFLRPDERVRYGALAALEHEWLWGVRDVQEPQVAAAKLGWWREEMQRAAEGQARHPLTQALSADARMKDVPPRCWTAPLEAAMVAFSGAPPADFVSQCESVAPLAHALAELETRVWFGECIEARKAGRVVLFDHLVTNARALESEAGHGRSPVPMNLLARHGLTIDGLGHDSAPRRAALRDYLAELERGLADAAKMPGVLTLFRAAGLQQDHHALGRALQAVDPLPSLRAPAYGMRGLLKTWRAARTWRGMARSGSRT
jgi:15-cis-phytoene synthase